MLGNSVQVGMRQTDMCGRLTFNLVQEYRARRSTLPAQTACLCKLPFGGGTNNELWLNYHGLARPTRFGPRAR